MMGPALQQEKCQSADTSTMQLQVLFLAVTVQCNCTPWLWLCILFAVMSVASRVTRAA